MKQAQLIKDLEKLETKNIRILKKNDFYKLYPDESPDNLKKSLKLMVANGILLNPARGIYLSSFIQHNGYLLEEIVKALRPGKICYVSLESMLSEYGLISQIPMSTLTVMTNGAGGIHHTPYGSIEFTHTKRDLTDILSGTVSVKDRPLRIAKKETALRDLYRVGRNINMLDQDELEDMNYGRI